jgi:hypothetical protein
MNNSKRQQKQTDNALTKKSDTDGEIVVPMTRQPSYPVPEADQTLRDSQTADWDLSQDIQILRFYLAKESQKGGNASVVAQLAKAVESLIRTNVSTALRTGEWQSRKSAREFVLAVINETSDVLRARLSPDEFNEAIDELRSRIMPMFSRESVAAANERNEQL